LPQAGDLALGLKTLTSVPSLKHLDISYNQINHEEIYRFAQYLKSNQTLIGLHMNGNMGFMDQYGFLHPIVNDFSEIEDHNVKRD
jgi:hypothetical protein